MTRRHLFKLALGAPLAALPIPKVSDHDLKCIVTLDAEAARKALGEALTIDQVRLIQNAWDDNLIADGSLQILL